MVLFLYGEYNNKCVPCVPTCSSKTRNGNGTGLGNLRRVCGVDSCQNTTFRNAGDIGTQNIQRHRTRSLSTKCANRPIFRAHVRGLQITASREKQQPKEPTLPAVSADRPGATDHKYMSACL